MISVLTADARAVRTLLQDDGHYTRLLHVAALQSADNQLIGGGRTSRASLLTGGGLW